MLPSASVFACRREERVQKAVSVDHHGPGDARLSASAEPSLRPGMRLCDSPRWGWPAARGGTRGQASPVLVRVDKPGVDIETVALMAKVGDEADGVHVFDGRPDISNETDAEEWIKSRGAEVAQLKSIPTWKHVKLNELKQRGIKPIRTMFVDKGQADRSEQNRRVQVARSSLPVQRRCGQRLCR